MAVKFKVKKGDNVKVIAGDDKGKTGEILQVLPKSGQVVVKGCKVAKKAIKPSEKIQKAVSLIKKCQWIFQMCRK